MFSNRLNRRRREGGFAMLDVLMGMAIFALIAVIAVQSTSLMRAKAQLKGVAGDAQSLAAGLESWMTENESFPTPAVAASPAGAFGLRGAVGAYPLTVPSSSMKDQRGLGVKLDPEHSVTRYWVDDATDGDPDASRAYQFCVVHTSGVWVAWTSAGDRIFAHSTSPATGTWNRDHNPCAP